MHVFQDTISSTLQQSKSPSVAPLSTRLPPQHDWKIRAHYVGDLAALVRWSEEPVVVELAGFDRDRSKFTRDHLDLDQVFQPSQSGNDKSSDRWRLLSCPPPPPDFSKLRKVLGACEEERDFHYVRQCHRADARSASTLFIACSHCVPNSALKVLSGFTPNWPDICSVRFAAGTSIEWV